VVSRSFGRRLYEALRTEASKPKSPLGSLVDRLEHDETMAALHSISPTPSGESFPIFNVSLADRKRFWGRKKLIEDLSTLLRGTETTAVLTQTLAGMGGVGKTQVAAQVAHRNRKHLDVVWWVSCASPNAPQDTQATLDSTTLARASFAALGEYLGLRGEDIEATVDRVRQWLEHTERRWLLIFDDAADASVIQGLVPSQGNGLVLITSRNPYWDQVDAVLSVEVFDTPSAAAFLSVRTGIDDPEGATELAEALGGLALALEQAGAFIVQSGRTLSFGDYLGELRDRGLRVFAHNKVDDYDHIVTTVWDRSLETLSDEHPKIVELLEAQRRRALC
jgi:hypothetical protein